MPGEIHAHRRNPLREKWKQKILFSGDDPTTEELELLKEHRKRVGLVIHARWALLVILAAYGLIASFLFRDKSADLEPLTTVQLIAPVAAVLLVVASHALFHMSSRRLSQIPP